MAVNSTPPAKDNEKLGRELFGLFFIFSSVLLLLSLATYDPRDPSLNHVVRGTVAVRNTAGLFGAYLSAIFADFFGIASYVMVLFSGLLGAKRTMNAKEWEWWRWFGFFPATCTIAISGTAFSISIADVSGGGLLGGILHSFFLRYFNPIGTGFIWFFIFLLSMQMIFGISWLNLFKKFLTRAQKKLVMQWAVFWKKQALLKMQRLESGPELKISTNKNNQPAQGQQETQEKNENNNLKPEQTAKKNPFKDFFSGSTSSSADKKNSQISKNDPLSISNAGAIQQNNPDFAPVIVNEKNVAPVATDKHLTPASNSNEIHTPSLGIATGISRPGFTGREETADGILPPWNKLSLAPEEPDDDDLPPWVKDLESGKIGLEHLSPSPSTPQIIAKITVETAKATMPVSDFTEQMHVNSCIDSKIPENKPADVSSSVIIDEAPQPIPSVKPETGVFFRRRMSLPNLDLLQSIKGTNSGTPRAELEVKGRTLMNCLGDFGIQGELVRITPGPVVTMFEVRPAPGVKVSRIAGLSDDLALSLKAIAVRVQAPIPGTDTVGIEIPNEQRETVCLKELFSSAAFQESESLLSMGLGKDIAGGPAVADLSRMPHLLVAGATGAGKSVCLNSILLSFLYKARPDEVKLLLIDPKRIEMAIYADLPHLVHPVVTEMSMAKNALDWAVSEMDRRYTDIARLGVRNVAAYNSKLAEINAEKPELAGEFADLEPMPYLVIVIDELADLMLTAAKEVEISIVRLAQLARAAGIHLILATQRPSVDVVTGLIKANFPCRISFQVTSKHDSRTILDAVGAEHLLGKGDMLFKPSGGRFQRLHGAFVSDDDVADVVRYWKKQAPANYSINFSDWSAENRAESFSGTGGGGSSADIISDPMYTEAVDFVSQQGKASISLIQRRFRIGFNRAARFIEQMEQDGIIGPADGSKPRQVVR